MTSETVQTAERLHGCANLRDAGSPRQMASYVGFLAKAREASKDLVSENKPNWTVCSPTCRGVFWAQFSANCWQRSLTIERQRSLFVLWSASQLVHLLQILIMNLVFRKLAAACDRMIMTSLVGTNAKN